MLLLAILPAVATGFLSNGIHYETLSDSTVTVAGYDSSDSDGDVIIPMQTESRVTQNTGYQVIIPNRVTHEGITYQVTAISDNAFNSLYRMRAVTIPVSVQTIGDNAFVGCSGLDTIFTLASIPPAVNAKTFNTIDTLSCTLAVREGSVTSYKTTAGWSSFTKQTELQDNYIRYYVNDSLYAEEKLPATTIFDLLEEPVKEGCTFSGWSGYPEELIMPAKDVKVYGSFSPNTYAITYYVNSVVYWVDSVAYGDTITLIEEPSKMGYTFSGWSGYPEDLIMTAKDVEVYGSFSPNTYAITYFIDSVVYWVDSVAYGDTITLIEEPSKVGYTFSGWCGYPEDLIMTAKDVVVYGSFSVNTYAITYYVDSVVYWVDSVAYGDTITLIEEPSKVGYTFSGWSGYPEDLIMPAEDIEVSGTFEEITAIKELWVEENNRTTTSEQGIYDLQGNKIGTIEPNKIYLIHGRKAMIR